MRNILLTLTLLSCLSTGASAQSEVDSLRNLLGKTLPDSLRIDVLSELCWNLQYQNADSSVLYGKKAAELAQKVGDKKRLSQALHDTGTAFYLAGDFRKALKYFESALKIRRKTGPASAIASSYNNIALVHQQNGDVMRALEFNLRAARIREKDTIPSLLAASYNNIGLIYSDLEDDERAEEYYRKNLKINEETKNSEGSAYAYNNLAQISYREKNYEQSADEYQKALRLWTEAGRESLVIYPLIGLSSNYLALKKYDSAKVYISQSREAARKTGNAALLRRTENLLGELAIETGDFAEGRKIMERIHNEAIAEKLPDFQASSARHLYKIYEKTGDYKKALKSLEEAQLIEDRLKSSKNIRTATKKIMDFAFEKEKEAIDKAAEIKKKEAESESRLQKIWLGLTVFSLLAAIGFSIYAYRNLRRKRADNALLEQQKEEIKQTNEELGTILEVVSSQKELLEKKHSDITASVNYAARIQAAVLPLRSAISEAFPEHFIFYEPRDIVSGDFYWYEEFEGKKILAAADCTGHGVPGAFMSMLGSQAFSEVVLMQKISDPGDILTNVNRLINNSLKQNENQNSDGMDVALAVSEPGTNKVLFAGAKNPLFYVTAGETETVKGDKMSVGGMQHKKNFRFKTHEITMETGDVFYLFSDGFQDQFGGPKNKKFMVKRFRDLLLEISGETPARQHEILEETLSEWMGSKDNQTDDILVIGVRI